MSENNIELDRNALFLQAIQERMSQMVVEYEAKVAELRVEFTIMSQERDALVRALEEASAVQASSDETD